MIVFIKFLIPKQNFLHFKLFNVFLTHHYGIYVEVFNGT